ncbi:MAG: ATP-binding protein [bacterium]|nr:ATP-binding protein [bacterium]
MKFYDRKLELKRINSLINISREKGSRVLVITGRRRIGKTRLALESVKNTDALYLFTKKKRIDELIHEWSGEIRGKLGDVFYGNFANLEELLTFLLDYSKQHPMVIVFDEVQNLLFSDPSAFGTFQKVYDLYREKSNALLIFLGSSFSLMNKIFKDSREPLFGRSSDIMTLSYLPLKAQEEMLTDAGLFSGENLLHLFAMFDGIPKYIEELIDAGNDDFIENFKTLLMSRDFMWEEGENLLKEEFGKEYSSYYSILSAIAKGRRQMNEIGQFTGIKDAGAYLKNLEETYRFIARRLPVTSKSSKDRNGRYYMNDNFMDFWFRHIETRRSLKEINRTETAFNEIIKQLPEYEGRKLEDMVIRKMIEENPLHIEFTRAGKYWDRKGTIEMDAVFMDDNRKKVYLFEVKRNRRKINPKLLEDLRTKAASVPEFKGFEILIGMACIESSGLTIEIVKCN